MIHKSSLRKRLGRIKCIVVDQWPYRGRVKAMPIQREKLRPLVECLPPLQSADEVRYEIHMLCCKRDLDMGIWASWSMMRFLAELFVHSDGTLADADTNDWRRIVGRVTLIHREQADNASRELLLPNAPTVHRWREIHWASPQLIDVHCFGKAPQILVMDSDVLTFMPPDEVIEALQSNNSRFGWSSDLLDAYSASPGLLREITGVTVPAGLCAGFLVTPRLNIEDYIRLEAVLQQIEADPRVELNHFWSCQTYYALLAGKVDGSVPFSRNYSNTAGRTSPDQVLRHYVGIPRVRYRYFREGVPRLLSQAGITF